MSSFSTYDLVTLSKSHGQFLDIGIPGSKSATIRALLLSAGLNHTTTIHNVLRSDDTQVMLEALKKLGASIEFSNTNTLTLTGPLTYTKEKMEFYLGESGLSLRLLLVHLSLFGKGPIYFNGQGRLLHRPLEGLIKPLRKFGVSIDIESDCIKIIPHSLPCASVEISIDPSVSSQWISALAMALAHHPFGGTLSFTKPFTSRAYLDVTSEWLHIFGCKQNIESFQWKIPGGLISPRTCSIEGDWSSAAAFILASATQGIPLCLKGLEEKTLQGDRFLLEILSRSSVGHRWKGGELHIEGKLKKGIREDLSSCPDLAPVLAAACVFGTEPSHLKGLQTLPDKESDRLQKIQELIHWLGGTCEIKDRSEVTIYPRTSIKRPSGAFDPDNDHRMAFAAALGALQTGGLLLNHTCVNKTLPQFWDLWNHMLGFTTSK
jgi:3-phosphoshikimate 1-carboxyvinyltransferase